MKLCHSLVNGWNWNIILSKVNQAQKAKIICSPSYAGYRLKTNPVLLDIGHILKGECTWRNRKREGNLKLECG
jgi:hypothetical protein